jgi:hypothetical protein
MSKYEKRLELLEEKTGGGGQHTQTIKYLNDWQRPPREPVTRVVPGLKEDTTILVEYVKEWRGP